MLVINDRKIKASDLNDRNKALLTALNLSVIMSTSVSVINPRYKAEALWVGLDVHAPANESKTITALAYTYFRAAEQESAYLYWSPVVKKQTKDGVIYLASSDKDISPDETAGFLFLSGKYIQSLFDSRNMKTSIELTTAAQKIIDDEIAEYNRWVNSGFTDITVSSLGDEFVSWVNGATDINEGFHKLVKNVLSTVDEDSNVMNMVLQIQGNDLNGEIQILSSLTSALERNFGVQLIYGSYSYNSDLKEFSVNFVGHAIPVIQDIVSRTENGIVDKIEKHSKILVGAGKFDNVDTGDTAKASILSSDFNELPALISQALIYSLIESVDFMDIIEIVHK